MPRPEVSDVGEVRGGTSSASRSPTPTPASTWQLPTGRSSCCPTSSDARSVPRCSVGSAGSAACSSWTSPATASRCSCPGPTVSARRSTSRAGSACSTPSGSTWSRWSSTTWSSRAPNRCSSTTTCPSGRSTPTASRPSCAVSPRGAPPPAARSSVARRPSTRACSPRTSSTSPGSAWAWSNATPSSAPTGSVPATPSWRWRRPVCTATATRWSAASSRATTCREHHGLDRPLGEVLLTPTRIYALDVLALLADVEVHALCHVTGGGLPGNLPRVLPDGLGATVDTGDVGAAGDLRLARRARARRPTTSCGAPSTAASAWSPSSRPTRQDDAVDHLAARGVDAWVAGRVDGHARHRPHAGRLTWPSDGPPTARRTRPPRDPDRRRPRRARARPAGSRDRRRSPARRAARHGRPRPGRRRPPPVGDDLDRRGRLRGAGPALRHVASPGANARAARTTRGVGGGPQRCPGRAGAGTRPRSAGRREPVDQRHARPGDGHRPDRHGRGAADRRHARSSCSCSSAMRSPSSAPGATVPQPGGPAARSGRTPGRSSSPASRTWLPPPRPGRTTSRPRSSPRSPCRTGSSAPSRSGDRSTAAPSPRSTGGWSTLAGGARGARAAERHPPRRGEATGRRVRGLHRRRGGRVRDHRGPRSLTWGARLALADPRVHATDREGRRPRVCGPTCHHERSAARRGGDVSTS